MNAPCHPRCSVSRSPAPERRSSRSSQITAPAWLMRWGAKGLAMGSCFALAAPLPAASAPAPAAPTADKIIELPKFEVTDSRLLPKPEKWHYAEIPGFEILSNLSERETKRFGRDFLLLQEAMTVLMPALRARPAAMPTSLILTGKGDAFDQFVPDERDRYMRNSLIFTESEHSAIVVDFQLAEIQIEDNTTLEADAYRSFYRDYFRQVIRQNTSGHAPAWFEEGLVQIFSAIDFDKKSISFAMVGDGFGGERTGDFNRILQKRALVPLAKLFQDPPTETGTFWNAEAYAFVHMCLYGRNNKYQKPFIEFLKRLDKEGLSEDLFKDCFKMSYKKMELELRGYIGFTDHKYMQFTAKKGQALPEPPPFVLKDAPDAVVGRIKGEALRMGGHGSAAHDALIAPYIRGERDPRLLAALGLDEVRAGQDERALKFLNAAANANVDRALAYLELARLRLKAAKAKPGAPNEQLTQAQVTDVLEPLFTARKLRPPMAEVYATIAEVWSVSQVPPQREHFDVVIEGVRLFPRNTDLLTQAIVLASRRGFPDDARSLAQFGEKVSTDLSMKEQFRMLGTMVERDADPNAAEKEAQKTPPKADSFLIKPEP